MYRFIILKFRARHTVVIRIAMDFGESDARRSTRSDGVCFSFFVTFIRSRLHNA